MFYWYTAPQESTCIAQQLSFEWSHCRTSSTVITYNQLVQHNKQYHRKALLKRCSLHLNNDTLGLHSQIQTLEPPCEAY